MGEKYSLEIDNLSKSFKNIKALNDLSFKVKKGELFGFLGLNGAGKTTTLSIILGIVKKNSGKIKVDGIDLDTKQAKNINNKIGIVFQESILDEKLSVYDNLMSRAAMYKKFFKDITTKELVDDVINDFQLHDLLKKSYGSLSGGQRRRVDIARALVHKPEILFLDEPTTGLDPNSRELVWNILRKIQTEKGLTILLTTHYMEEANWCNYAIILQKGHKLAEGTPAELKNQYSKTKIFVYQEPNSVLEDLFTTHNASFKYADRRYFVEFNTYKEAQDFVNKFGPILQDYELIKGTMDDVFLTVTKQESVGR
ncbi:ABC transporter ATP-binding protein [Mycoplasmopsis verecunda]|uniref:Multidrug/hemolysin transport system ATP-binding protein n=1 Tax=Mycoplasmopsis verecunda TaxID=171291 RepID=A0A1T4KSS3_9BACT|nr:ABC transporter ATP-binding protein [Mycoplasmopsis verecunda]WPB54672.1 ABC transporter ATP-binding protein [Mycoplasmopsis verecunda]SJZ45367.1 multidrug/hemolysin transport system ATP-binding protein [Mycoplasmopsis verecunda]